MLRYVSSDEKEKDKGFDLGQISFGIGGQSKTVADGADDKAKQAPAQADQQLKPKEKAEGEPLLPLRVLLLADLIPRGQFNAGANAPEQAIRIDTGDFEGVFKKLQPRCSIEVESVLAQGTLVRIDLAPRNMKSFRPDGLSNEVPLLRSLLDGKKVLERLRDGTVEVEQAAQELERLWTGSPFARQVLDYVVKYEVSGAPAGAAAPAPQPEASSAVDDILSMVDTGTTADADSVSAAGPTPVAAAPAAPSKKSKFGAFIEAVAKSGRKGKPGANPDEGIRRIEKAVGLQLGEILQHSEVRRLEQAWRGVEFIVDRAHKIPGIRLELVSASPTQAAEALDRAIRANASVEPPVSFAVVDDCVDGDNAAFERLRALGEVAETHTVPLITNGSAALFGKNDLAEVDQLDNKAALYDAPERVTWRSASHQLAMRWVTIAMNRVLVRGAYDRRSSRIREAYVEEMPNDENAVVWMEPCWAVGSVVINSFRKTGWPCRVTGARNGGTIENLPVREVRLHYEGVEKIAIPTEVMVSVDTQKTLARYGILVLATMPNTDEAYLVSAPTAYVTPPKRTYDSDTTEPEVRLPQVSLGDQLFVARLVQFLRALGSKIPPGSDPDQLQPVMEAAIYELFENAPPPGPEIAVKAVGDGGAEYVSVTVRPRRFLSVAMEEISLDIPLG